MTASLPLPPSNVGRACEPIERLGITVENFQQWMADARTYPDELWDRFPGRTSVFFDRYFGRDGRRGEALDINTINVVPDGFLVGEDPHTTLLDVYRSSESVQAAVRRLLNDINYEISVKVGELGENVVGSVITGFVDKKDRVNVVNEIYSIGSGPLRAAYSATDLSDEGTYLDAGMLLKAGYEYEALITFVGDDPFVDAADLCDSTPTDLIDLDGLNNEEFPGGTPFIIQVRWNQVMRKKTNFSGE